MARSQVSARMYDGSIYDFARMPPSYWASTVAGSQPIGSDLAGDVITDVAVIGGGYTGLSAANELAERYGQSVAVLEAGAGLGWGASSRNGGFVAAGGTKLSAQEMIKKFGLEEAKRYWRSQTEAVEYLRAFDADAVGEGSVCVAHHPKIAAALKAEADVLKTALGVDAAFVEADAFRERYHSGPETFGAQIVKPGYGVNPHKLVLELGRQALKSGCQIFTRAEVVAWHRAEGRHHLKTAAGGTVKAKRVVIATNGYAADGLNPAFAFRNLPAISSIIVTEPYSDRELHARKFYSQTPVYTSRNLLAYYRRLPDGRILFGCRGDTKGTPEAAQNHARLAQAEMVRLLPTFADARVAFSWRGLISLTARKTLAIAADPADASVVSAFGCHGSGVATMTWAGRMAAGLVTGAIETSGIPAVFQDLPPKLPRSSFLRRSGLRAAYRYYAVRDALRL